MDLITKSSEPYGSPEIVTPLIMAIKYLIFEKKDFRKSYELLDAIAQSKIAEDELEVRTAIMKSVHLLRQMTALEQNSNTFGD